MRLRFIIYLSLVCFIASGQKRSAQNAYQEALSEMNNEKAGALFAKAIAKDSTYADAYLQLARVYAQTRQDSLQVSALQLASRHCADQKATIYARLSLAAYLNGQYAVAQEAMAQLDAFSDNELGNLSCCIDYSLYSVEQNLPFAPKNLGPEVNTEFHDYWPSFSIDESQLVITVYDDVSQPGVPNEDFYISHSDGGGWTPSVPMSESLNTSGNEGAQCLSADGKLMFFTACNRRDGFGRCDLYVSSFSNGGWTRPRPLPEPINSPSWEGHPCLSADGQWLYFSSDRPGGYGGKDLYMVKINAHTGSVVGDVFSLGEPVNTQKDEISPFLHPDGKTLYFSSDGHIGLGRQDVYLTQQGKNGYDQLPYNMGYPINTHNDEIGLVVNTQGDKGYFASERDDSRLKDIYSFEMPERLRPQEVTYFKGKIFDSQNQKSVLAQVELRNRNTGELLYESPSSAEFILALPLGEDYAVHVSSPGYLFYSDNFPLSEDAETPFEKNIMLSPIKSGEALILNNILFAHDSYQLDSTFTDELDMVLTLVVDNPDLQFEISGHTDAVGNDDYNLELSQQRALSVYNYLISHGANATQLTHVGYGSTHPVSSRHSDNRRTELLVK